MEGVRQDPLYTANRSIFIESTGYEADLLVVTNYIKFYGYDPYVVADKVLSSNYLVRVNVDGEAYLLMAAELAMARLALEEVASSAFSLSQLVNAASVAAVVLSNSSAQAAVNHVPVLPQPTPSGSSADAAGSDAVNSAAASALPNGQATPNGSSADAAGSDAVNSAGASALPNGQATPNGSSADTAGSDAVNSAAASALPNGQGP